MDVDSYIKKQKSPQKEILEKLRGLIKKTFKGIKEEIRRGVPAYDKSFYIVGLRDKVNMGFCVEGLTKEQQNMFEGKGDNMRHIKIFTKKDIDEKKIVKLMKMVRRLKIQPSC